MRPIREGEDGFTLVELLAAITILGVISLVLTEAILLSLKTVDSATKRAGNSVTTQTLESYFSGDAQSAVGLSAGAPACGSDRAVVNMTWTDDGTAKSASYVLDPPAGAEHDLVRWFCAAGASPERKILGHFVQDAAGPPPVSAAWTPSTVTLTVQSTSSTPGGELVVTRRAQA